MDISLKPLVFCLAIAAASLVVVHPEQAFAAPRVTHQREQLSQIAFDPEDAGQCVGDKCAAGGSY